MKIVDVNILVFAVNRASPYHPVVRGWLEGAFNGAEPAGIAWAVILGFLRLTSNPRIFDAPLSIERAIAQINEWLTRPNSRIVAESTDHGLLVSRLLRDAGATGSLAADVHLAALAISHGATLVSCDSDFHRFPSLRCENPIQS